MYSLDINFLKYHPDYNKKVETKVRKPINLGNLIPVYIGVGVGLVLPAIVYGVFSFIQIQANQVTEEITKLEEEGKSLDGKITNLNKLKTETKTIQSQTTALITVFDQIRPWSAMLQDLRDRIPPRVQIETIRQTPPIILPPNTPPSATTTVPNAGTLEISGYGRGYADINDFVLSLGKSKFLNAEETKIKNAELIDAPPITGFVILANNNPGVGGGGGVTIKPPKVVKYTIKAYLNTTPASELIQELEKKGTSGLVTRLRNLKNTEVETK